MTEHITKPQVQVETVSIPVIFADGENDDLPGLVAAIEGKPFLFDGELYAPDRDLDILGRRLVVTRCIYVIAHDNADVEPLEWDECTNFVVCREQATSRAIRIEWCNLDASRCGHVGKSEPE